MEMSTLTRLNTVLVEFNFYYGEHYAASRNQWRTNTRQPNAEHGCQPPSGGRHTARGREASAGIRKGAITGVLATHAHIRSLV